MYVAFWAQKKIMVHSKKQAQVGALLFDKALFEVPADYSDYNNVFSAENATELLENIGINEYAIELEEGKQPLFSLSYNLGPIELETLKTYIKINLTNNFIRPFKSLDRAFILLNKKPDRSFRFYIDYRVFNNITIQN